MYITQKSIWCWSKNKIVVIIVTLWAIQMHFLQGSNQNSIGCCIQMAVQKIWSFWSVKNITIICTAFIDVCRCESNDLKACFCRGLIFEIWIFWFPVRRDCRFRCDKLKVKQSIKIYYALIGEMIGVHATCLNNSLIVNVIYSRRYRSFIQIIWNC